MTVGRVSFDRRHILTLNYIYNIPGFNQSQTWRRA